jgi:hypothetical protein
MANWNEGFLASEGLYKYVGLLNVSVTKKLKKSS